MTPLEDHQEDTMNDDFHARFYRDQAAELGPVMADALDRAVAERTQEDDMLDSIPEPVRLTFDDGWTLDLSRTGDDFVELDWTPSGSQRTTLDVMHVWEAESLRDALTALLGREADIMPKPTDTEETNR